jgi:hypothetical protein
MQNMWDGVSVVEDVATAGSGAANAAYFARRAWLAHGPRRLAAGLLALLCASSALAAVGAGDPGPASVLAQAPLLAANLAVSALLWVGAGR